MPLVMKHRKPVKHTKTFSGCWSCRKRHLKCDEGRPECQRCVRAKIRCEGYEVKLVWTNSDGSANQQNIRRQLNTEPLMIAAPLPICGKVDEMLRDLDTLESSYVDQVSGPFSVFAVTPRTGISKSCMSLTPSRVFNHGNDEDLLELSRSNPASWGTPVILREQDSDQQMIHNLQNHASHSFNRQFMTSRLTRQLNFLSCPSEQKMLLHFWTTTVSARLVPCDSDENPFRTILTPMAINGLMSPSHQNSGQMALLHAICCLAATCKGMLSVSDTESQMMKMKHYHQTITNLRQSVETLSSSQRVPVLATIMAISTMDMMTGSSTGWRTHLQAGAVWLTKFNAREWEQDDSSSFVYQAYMSLVALCNVDVSTSVIHEFGNLDRLRFNWLGRVFSLTQQKLYNIMRINNLIKQKSATKAEIDKLEQDLHRDTPEKVDLDHLDAHAQAISMHHAYVSYYASLLYFERSVRRLSPDVVQTMVIKALGHLEAIEKIGGDNLGTPLVFPAFMVACECQGDVLQSRMIEWYETQKRHGFENLQVSCDVAQEVWRRRNQEPHQDVHWQDVLTDLKLDLILA